MPEYQAFVIGPDGHVMDRHDHDLTCADDEAAMERAQQLADSCDIELWQGERRIAVFEVRRDNVQPAKRSQGHGSELGQCKASINPAAVCQSARS